MDFLKGFMAGIFVSLAIAHLLLQKRITLSGWVEKNENPALFWLFTAIYTVGGIAATLYMVYT